MRWVWVATRHVRLRLRQQHILSTTGAPLLGTRPTDPLLQNTGRQRFTTREKSQPRLATPRVLPRRPQLPRPEEQSAVERGKPPVNPPKYPRAYEPRKATEYAEAVQQGYTPGHTKNDASTTTAELANSADPTQRAKFVKTIEPAPFELAKVADYKKIEEFPNATDRTTGAEDLDMQPAGHSLAFSTYSRPQEPRATTSSDCAGVIIDAHGHLRITSITAALRKSRTALIVGSVSRNLVEADFTRLLAHAPDRGNDLGGFVRAIPGRDTDFNRLSYWILLFDSPYNAASFQHRLCWYHANAKLNLPVDPYTAATTKNRELTPPEGYVDPLSGENIWKRLHEFSVLLPTQSFNVTAMLEPFPETICTDIRNHELWRFPITAFETWPVRVWIDGYHLDASLVSRVLEQDGTEGGRRWKLTGTNPVEPMFYTAFNSRGNPINRDGAQISKKDIALLRESPQKNWVIRFCVEEDALLFWRTWHRRPLPESISRSPGKERLLHVDPLW